MSDNDDHLKPIRQNPKMKIQEIENINICLQFLKKEGVNLVNIDASDIWNGKLSSILAVIWNMVLKYQVSGFYYFCFSERIGENLDKCLN